MEAPVPYVPVHEAKTANEASPVLDSILESGRCLDIIEIDIIPAILRSIPSLKPANEALDSRSGLLLLNYKIIFDSCSNSP